MRTVDTDRAFINMVLTKGEADQRGSRRARCVCRGAFQDGTAAGDRRDGELRSIKWHTNQEQAGSGAGEKKIQSQVRRQRVRKCTNP